MSNRCRRCRCASRPSGVSLPCRRYESVYETSNVSPGRRPRVRAIVRCISASPGRVGQRPSTCARSHMPSRQYVGATNGRPPYVISPPGSRAHAVADDQYLRTDGSPNKVSAFPRRVSTVGGWYRSGSPTGRSSPSCAGTENERPVVYGARSSMRVSSRCSADARPYIGPSTVALIATTQTSSVAAFIRRRVQSPASSSLMRRPRHRPGGAARRPATPRTAPASPRGTGRPARRGCGRRRPRRPPRTRGRADPPSRSCRCGW
jgi:hypothetical protein